MDIEKALENTNFVKCNFGPDGDCCDKCDKPNLQLYYRRTCWEVDEGQYHCANCVISEAEENARITEVTCGECGEKFTGWPEEDGQSCFDCFAAKTGMPT